MTHILVRIEDGVNIIIDMGNAERMRSKAEQLRRMNSCRDKLKCRVEYAIEEVKAVNTGE